MTRDDLVRRVLLFGALLGWCAMLLVFRALRSGSLSYAFLAWNLFLATVPAVAAWLFVRAATKGSAAGVQLGWFVLWLVFLPNAPYIVTDFLHLTERPAIPLWYDIAQRLADPLSHPQTFGVTLIYGGALLLGYIALRVLQPAISGSDRRDGPFVRGAGS